MSWSATDENHLLVTDQSITRFKSYFAAKANAIERGLKNYSIYYFKDAFPLNQGIDPAEIVGTNGMNMYAYLLRRQDNYVVGREQTPHILTAHASSKTDCHVETRFENYYAAKAAALELPNNKSFTIWADKSLQYCQTEGQEERSFSVKEMVEQKITKNDEQKSAKTSKSIFSSFF